MKRVIFAAALALSGPSLAHAALPAGVTDSSYTAPDGSRAMQESIEIDAPAAVVWKLFSDPATIKASGVADAWVDLRNGGSLDEALFPDARAGDPRNIRHQIITYVPGRLMVLQNLNTPPGLPGREAFKTVVQIVEVTDLGGGRSRLTLTVTGYGPGAEYDALWAFFHDHNGEFLTGAKALAEKIAKMG
jgi:uncharacterized protein YndB with AHSA1/START domain